MILNKKLSQILLTVILIYFSIAPAVAEPRIYTDDFNDHSKHWEQINGDWTFSKGMTYIEGSQTSLIFKDVSDEKFIFKSIFSAEDTKVENYSQVGFYIYYEDKDNYARIICTDDNREDKKDLLKIESKGVSVTNSKAYLEMGDNKTFSFSPEDFKEVKVVRIKQKFWVYYNDILAYEAEFEDSTPDGYVGYNVYASTGYFDNFYLRPIEMENASKYVDKLSLSLKNSHTPISWIYILNLEEVSNGDALFSLSKFGETVDTYVASEGDTVTLNFENGEDAVNFKVTKLIDAGDNSAVWIEDIISANTEDLVITIDDVIIDLNYYQEEDMKVGFSIVNKGGIKFTGMPEITVKTEDNSQIINPDLNLNGGGLEKFDVLLKAPRRPGNHKLVISINNEYSTLDKSVDYQVRALNPAVTLISTNLEENDGIRGVVNIGSTYSSELVDWDTTGTLKVYAIIENGKKELYSEEIPVYGSTFSVAIPYEEFYKGDGQYLVSVNVGGMQDTELFEIVGPDYVYLPTEEKLPPTIVSNELYPQIMLFLIGMFAALSVKNHVHRKHRSLPLNLLSIICGIGVLVSALVKANTGMATLGIILMGTGIGSSIIIRKGAPLGELISRNTHLHDFAGMLLISLSAIAIVIHIPEWNFLIIVGVLIAYSTGLNLYNKQESPEKDEGEFEKDFLIPLE